MRLSFLAMALILVSAQTYATTEQQLTECSVIPDKLDRLICYDNLAASIQGASAQISVKAIAPVAVAVPTAAVSTTAASTAKVENEFGIAPKPVQEDIVDKIYLDVESIAEDAYGALKITFTNGQVWKQTENRKFNLKVGEKVFIEKAALGSFLMGTESRNAKVRVKRLK
ncbi:hypothetical protein N7V09_04550 [Shewanella seohaensis]|uniref:hypothetical protein n=1 Tax=Shewanella seohaensis TaxID=755175 RepID=UPI00200BAC9A|nr:hypothetical protein [Shewanella seohaensis]MCL1122670.1 hypothetical protein [Shewanella seohaensis]UXM82854.1 hypothetical protein N7V09_04550 [Shewanella seohaensis]